MKATTEEIKASRKQKLSRAQQEVLAAVGTKWQQAPTLAKSGTLLALKHRYHLGFRVAPKYTGAPPALLFRSPYTAFCFQWKRLSSVKQVINFLQSQ